MLCLQSLDHVTWKLALGCKYMSSLKKFYTYHSPRMFKGILNPKSFNVDQHISDCNVTTSQYIALCKNNVFWYDEIRIYVPRRQTV